MKEDRLHIHLVHLEEAKPSEMPVEAHRRTRDYSQVQLCDAHIFPSSPPISFSLFIPEVFSLSLSSCLSVWTLVFHHLQLRVFYRRPSSHWSWRVSACTVIVSYRQSSKLIRPLLCARVFFSLFFFLPCRHAFIFPQLLIIKLFIIQASQAIDVPPLTERGTVSVIFA